MICFTNFLKSKKKFLCITNFVKNFLKNYKLWRSSVVYIYRRVHRGLLAKCQSFQHSLLSDLIVEKLNVRRILRRGDRFV